MLYIENTQIMKEIFVDHTNIDPTWESNPRIRALQSRMLPLQLPTNCLRNCPNPIKHAAT